MKLKAIKVYHSLKVANSEVVFLTDDKFEMELDSIGNFGLISVKEKRGSPEVTFTTLANVIWFKTQEEKPQVITPKREKAAKAE